MAQDTFYEKIEMFTTARLKLTLFYAAFFLCFFWIVSISLYVWMDHSIGGSMLVNQVKQQEQYGQHEGNFNEQSVTLAGAVALDQLKLVLLVLNCGLVPLIPLLAWLLTSRTLAPVQAIQERQEQFTADVSHELRIPLSILNGEIEVALKKKRTMQEYHHTLSSAREETERLRRLVEDLLLLTRMEQGTPTGTREEVDLTDLIMQVRGSLEPQRQEKQLTIHVIPAEESLVIIGQELLLRHLLFNLLENAIKYTPEQGTITITIAREKHDGLVTIKDTGIGMAPNHQARIFDRFYRIDSARSETPGYGLGLALVKKIVTLHNGNIQVHSVLRQGTTFVLSFPCVSIPAYSFSRSSHLPSAILNPSQQERR